MWAQYIEFCCSLEWYVPVVDWSILHYPPDRSTPIKSKSPDNDVDIGTSDRAVAFIYSLIFDHPPSS
jgi:hypothetical protein